MSDASSAESSLPILREPTGFQWCVRGTEVASEALYAGSVVSRSLSASRCRHVLYVARVVW